jgi:hypothetical protein
MHWQKVQGDACMAPSARAVVRARGTHAGLHSIMSIRSPFTSPSREYLFYDVMDGCNAENSRTILRICSRVPIELVRLWRFGFPRSFKGTEP